jgi:hypothetical protein
MKLHGNAALSLNKRRILCQRVVDAGWSLGLAETTVSGILTRIGWESSAGSGSSPPCATSAVGLASCCTSTSRSAGGSRVVPASGT